MYKYFDCSRLLIMLFPSKIKGISRLHLSVTVQFAFSSSINDSNETLKCESSMLSLVCSTEDEMLRFYLITHEEEALHNACHLIFIERSKCSHLSTSVHQVCFIAIVITPQMNDCD